jgi:hypothetical protein
VSWYQSGRLSSTVFATSPAGAQGCVVTSPVAGIASRWRPAPPLTPPSHRKRPRCTNVRLPDQVNFRRTSTRKRPEQEARKSVMESLGISRDLQDVSEDILVQRAKGRDDQAFCELARRSRASCLGLAITILRNREDAIEEVANGFCKAYTRIESLSQETKFSNWVSRIVINYCLTKLRKARIARFVPYEGITEDGDSYTAHEARACDTPETQLGQREGRTSPAQRTGPHTRVPPGSA